MKKCVLSIILSGIALCNQAGLHKDFDLENPVSEKNKSRLIAVYENYIKNQLLTKNN